jgi:16S rRNA (cytosine1402-N4)-methyltransferase
MRIIIAINHLKGNLHRWKPNADSYYLDAHALITPLYMDRITKLIMAAILGMSSIRTVVSARTRCSSAIVDATNYSRVHQHTSLLQRSLLRASACANHDGNNSIAFVSSVPIREHHARRSVRAHQLPSFSLDTTSTLSRRHYHSSSCLMAKRKKNGGKTKKAEKPPSKRSIKLSKVAELDDDDEDDDFDDTLDFEDLEEQETTASTTTTPFATEYHAPVMPNECIDALLQQGVFGELMKDKKERWRKRKSIVEAKLEKAGLLEDDDDDDDDSDDDDEVENEEASNSAEATSERIRRPRLFVDGTLGGGGHSQALLEQLHPEDILIGCDQDSEAISTASARLSKYLGTSEYIVEKNGQLACGWVEGRPMFIPVQSNFRNLVAVLSTIRHPTSGKLLLGKRLKNQESETEEELEFPNGVNGMLLDLGVSSHQINTGERGFAFMKEGPLDMRMDSNSTTAATSSLTAADICNEFDESTLISILRTYGDEPRAKRIASAIIESRPLHTTTDLVHAINSVTPTFARQKRAGLIATSARVFQALRIVVNEEDGALTEVLERVAPWALSRSGGHHSNVGNNRSDGDDGILAVLSYHSMEDKMAKRVIRDGSVDLVGRRGRGGSLFERDLFGNIIQNDGDEEEGSHVPFEPLGKPQKATEEEVAINSRARSATLRVGIRI